jgi:hypothetical protein
MLAAVMESELPEPGNVFAQAGEDVTFVLGQIGPAGRSGFVCHRRQPRSAFRRHSRTLGPRMRSILDIVGPPPADDGESRSEQFFETVETHIRDFGYHLTYVYEEPPFCYSVGFSQTWNHPELLVYGLGFDDAAIVLTGLAGTVRAGRRFADGDVDSDTFDRPVAFVAIPPDERFGRFIVTIEYYSVDFDALQVVTSDGAGRFPWQADYDAALVRGQPLLGPVPPHLSGNS